jgi:hypothetical protein
MDVSAINDNIPTHTEQNSDPQLTNHQYLTLLVVTWHVDRMVIAWFAKVPPYLSAIDLHSGRREIPTNANGIIQLRTQHNAQGT